MKFHNLLALELRIEGGCEQYESIRVLLVLSGMHSVFLKTGIGAK